MLVGHMGLAYIVKKEQPQIGLWVLFIATYLIDIVDALLEIIGVRLPYSWTPHFLPGTIGLSMICFIIGFIMFMDIVPGILIGLLTLSHTMVDYITSKMPLWANGPEFGLNWYRIPLILFPIEAVVIVIGWNMYRKTFKPEKRSKAAVWILLAYLLTLQAVKNFLL